MAIFRCRKKRSRGKTSNPLSRSSSNLKADSLPALKILDNLEQVARLRVAQGPEHSHQALGRMLCRFREFSEAEGCVNVVSKDCFAGLDVSANETFHTG